MLPQPQLLGGKMARHEVAPYVGPQLAEAIGIATTTWLRLHVSGLPRHPWSKTKAGGHFLPRRQPAAEHYMRYLNTVRQGEYAEHAYQKLVEWGYIKKGA